MQCFDHILRNLRLFLLFNYLFTYSTKYLDKNTSSFVRAKNIEEKIRYVLQNLVLNANPPYNLVAYWAGVVKNLKI